MIQQSQQATRFVLASACLGALLGSSGCAAMQAARQPSKKDLTVLMAGVPRTHVIAELGAPVWTEERDNGTIDVFAFKQGYSKGVKAARAFGHAAADFLTFGLWEAVGTPMEILADGTNMKIEVCYDATYNVEAVHIIEGQQALADPGWLAKVRRRKRLAHDPLPRPHDTVSETALAAAPPVDRH
jgi:hypothetical protein